MPSILSGCLSGILPLRFLWHTYFRTTSGIHRGIFCHSIAYVVDHFSSHLIDRNIIYLPIHHYFYHFSSHLIWHLAFHLARHLAFRELMQPTFSQGAGPVEPKRGHRGRSNLRMAPWHGRFSVGWTLDSCCHPGSTELFHMAGVFGRQRSFGQHPSICASMLIRFSVKHCQPRRSIVSASVWLVVSSLLLLGR